VIISVIYLSIQIEGSNKQLQAQSYNDTLEILHRPLELVVQDSELSDIALRAGAEPTSLTPSEWYRYSALLMLKFDAYEHAYYANENSEIRPELWRGIDASFAEDLRSNSGFRRFWAQSGKSFAEPFHGFIEAKLHERGP
jgi:hypothetical protein